MLAATGEGHPEQTNLHDMPSMLDAKTTAGGCFVKLNLSIIAFQLLKHSAFDRFVKCFFCPASPILTLAIPNDG